MEILLAIIACIVGLFIYIIVKDEKRINAEKNEYDIKINWLCDYIGGIPLFDENKNNIGKQMDVQVRGKTNSLYIKSLSNANEIDISINNITNMESKTKEQIISKQVSPSLTKILTFGVFSIGMGTTETAKLTEKYLIVEYKDEKCKEVVFALRTSYAEDYIREIKHLKGEEYVIDIKNCI